MQNFKQSMGKFNLEPLTYLIAMECWVKRAMSLIGRWACYHHRNKHEQGPCLRGE